MSLGSCPASLASSRRLLREPCFVFRSRVAAPVVNLTRIRGLGGRRWQVAYAIGSHEVERRRRSKRLLRWRPQLGDRRASRLPACPVWRCHGDWARAHASTSLTSSPSRPPREQTHPAAGQRPAHCWTSKHANLVTLFWDTSPAGGNWTCTQPLAETRSSTPWSAPALAGGSLGSFPSARSPRETWASRC